MKLQRRCDFVYLGINAGDGIRSNPPFVQFIYSLALLYDYSFIAQVLLTGRFLETVDERILRFFWSLLLEFPLVTMCRKRADFACREWNRVYVSLVWGM